MSEKVTRKLTTIFAADAEGFSTAMTQDEVGTYVELHAARDVFFKLIERHGGRVANTAGDGLIAEFPSVVEAVRCAIETQRELGARNSALGFRIGVHLGDVIVDGDDLIGEGVNLAARLQTMAEPGGVLISQQVYDQVHAKLSIGFEYLGERRPRNLSEDVSVYRVSTGRPKIKKRTKASVKPTAKPPKPTPVSEPTEPLNLVRYFKLGALLAAALLVVDLATPGAIWAHWPITVFAALAGVRWAPLLPIADRISPEILKLGVLATALALINVYSWDGYPWALWPIGGLVLLTLIRKITARP